MKVLLLAAFLFISFTIGVPVMITADTKIPSTASTTTFATGLEARDEEDPPFVSPTVYKFCFVLFYSFKFNSSYSVSLWRRAEKRFPLFCVLFYFHANRRDLNNLTFSLLITKQDEITCNLRKKTYTQLAITSRIRNGIAYLFHHGGFWTVPPYGTTRPSCSWHSAIFVINEVNLVLRLFLPHFCWISPTPFSPLINSLLTCSF